MIPDSRDFPYVVSLRTRRIFVLNSMIMAMAFLLLISGVFLIVLIGGDSLVYAAILALCIVMIVALVGYTAGQMLWLARQGWVIAASKKSVVVLGEFGFFEIPWAMVRNVSQGRGLPLNHLRIDLEPAAAEQGAIRTNKRQVNVNNAVRHGLRVSTSITHASAQDIIVNLRKFQAKMK